MLSESQSRKLPSVPGDIIQLLLASSESVTAAGLISDCMQRPLDPVPLYELSKLCFLIGDLPAWTRLVQIAMGMEHLTPEAVYDRGCAKVTLGDWSGWKDREARHLRPSYCQTRSGRARTMAWRTARCASLADVTDKRVLVYCEEGYGDRLLMSRFIPSVAAAARCVSVRIDELLRDLIHHNYGSDTVTCLARDDRTPDVDRYIWGMALPTLVDTIPPFKPLLAPRPSQLSPRRTRLRLGLCWAGSAEHQNEIYRRIPLSTLAPVISRADIEWYSLHVGPCSTDANAFPEIRQPTPPLITFADTANLMSALDGVVSTDTSVAHLAGSMGIPVVLLLSTAPSWMWGLGDTTPWYPSMRIIRQQRKGEWPPVVARLQDHLQNWI